MTAPTITICPEHVETLREKAKGREFTHGDVVTWMGRNALTTGQLGRLTCRGVLKSRNVSREWTSWKFVE